MVIKIIFPNKRGGNNNCEHFEIFITALCSFNGNSKAIYEMVQRVKSREFVIFL